MVATATAVTMVVALVSWAFIEPRILLVSRTTVVSPDVPAALDGTRIVFLSDIHSGSLLGEGRVSHVVDRVNALKPDVIILGGDYIGGGGGEKNWLKITKHVKRLRAPLGIVAVAGNHEAGWSAQGIQDEILGGNATVLDNRSVRVGAGGGPRLRIAGVSDYLTGEPDFEAAASEISRDEYAIVVSHSPDALPDGLAKTRGAFDLALSGHNHGGQVTIFGLWAPATPSKHGSKYLRGWFTIEGVPSLVSRGVGVYILPIRFFAPPEIHVLTLRRAAAG